MATNVIEFRSIIGTGACDKKHEKPQKRGKPDWRLKKRPLAELFPAAAGACTCGGGASFEARMIEFIRPILERFPCTREGARRAFGLGHFFWHLSLTRDAALRELAIAQHLDTEPVFSVDPLAFNGLAQGMIERHREIFPEMHGGRTAGQAGS